METGTYHRWSMHTSIGIKSENRRPSCDVSNITTCYSIERHRRAVPWKIRMSEDVVTRQSQLVRLNHQVAAAESSSRSR